MLLHLLHLLSYTGIKNVLLKHSTFFKTTWMASSSSSHTGYGRRTFWSGFSVRLRETLDQYLGQNVTALLPEQQRTLAQQEETTIKRFVPDHLEIILTLFPQQNSGLSSGSQNLMSAVPKTWNPLGSQKTVTGKKIKDLLNKSKHIKSKNMLFHTSFVCYSFDSVIFSSKLSEYTLNISVWVNLHQRLLLPSDILLYMHTVQILYTLYTQYYIANPDWLIVYIITKM